MEFIDLEAQYRHLQKKIDARIHKVLDHGKYIMGPEVEELEKKLAEFVGVKHAITCANGTDALQLALMVLNIKFGDAVFCPTFTFFATAEVIAYAGATPVFVDVDERTFNICPIDLERQIQRIISEGQLNAKAVIAVDLFGLPANYPKIREISSKYSLSLIEDAAQGFGGEISGKMAASFGDISTTSFFPAKPLGCYGDGGAVFTDNDEYAELCRSFRVHGKGKDKYDNVRIGINSRLDTIQAAILLEKLDVFPDELIKRNNIAEYYSQRLNDKFLIPWVPKEYKSSWAQYSLINEFREMHINKLNNLGIPTGIYYKTCMHQQAAFKELGYSDDHYPRASRLARQVFSLPMHPYLSLEEQQSILEKLCE